MRGPGVHEMMIYHFVSLNLKQTGFASYVDSINQLQRLHHTKDALSYYDCISLRKQSLFCTDAIYEPFSSFYDTNEYNGIKLTMNLFKSCVLLYWKTRETYWQASFQQFYDEANAADHTHKYANVIRAGPFKGRVFTAAYSVLSMLGFVNLFRLTYTKGNHELIGLMDQYKEARTFVNAPDLKCFTSDNLSGDGSNWKKTFESLSDDTKPYKFLSKNLPTITIDETNIDYLNTIELINRVASSLLDKYGRKTTKFIYGFDLEWNRGERGARMIIISLPTETVKLFHISAAGIFNEHNFPLPLKTFLELPTALPTGVNVGGDCGRMRRFGVKMTSWVELINMAKIVDPTLGHYSMKDLTERFLGVTVNKSIREDADYEIVPLPEELQIYAAADGRLSLRLYFCLHKEVSNGTDAIREAPSELIGGNFAKLLIGTKVVAEVEIIYVGGKPSIIGEVKKWGMTSVKKGKALVKVCSVFYENARPPYSFRATNSSDEISWKKEEKCLNDLRGHEIMVNTSSLSLVLENREDDEVAIEVIDVENDSVLKLITSVEEKSESINECVPDNNVMEIEEMLSLIYEEKNDDHEAMPRSRTKHDIFHKFQDLPIKKTEPLCQFVSRLLIHATFQFDKDDYKRIVLYLKQKFSWTNDPTETDKIMDHFYHNREWWRQRCKTSIPKADDHAKSLKKICQVIRADAALKTLWDNELEDYFDKMIMKSLRGDFEELPDVIQFIRIGYDSHNLPLYVRLKGTVRNENLHQKCKTAMGPWNIGAMTAHYMLVHLCYRYNIHTDIKRNGAYKFGHYEYYFIDRIQNRIQQIYNVIIWPRHRNVSNFKAKKNFISVGIGPLTFQEDYVQVSDSPAPHLKGDLQFVAKQMGLKYPLRLMGTPKELKIFNEFFSNGKNRPTEERFKELAKMFNLKSDGKTVFPKLPSMIKAFFKNWEKNKAIRCSEIAISFEAKRELQNLFLNKSTYQGRTEDRINPNSNADKDLALLNEKISNEKETTNSELFCNEDALGSETETCMPVPPMMATGQIQYVQEEISGAKRKCAAFPFCIADVSECFGFNHPYTCARKHNFFMNGQEQRLESNVTLGQFLQLNPLLLQQLHLEKKKELKRMRSLYMKNYRRKKKKTS